MQPYASILEALLQAITQKSEPKVVGIVPHDALAADQPCSYFADGFPFPRDMVPPCVTLSGAPDGEAYITHAINLARETDADCILLVPPSFSEPRQSVEFRRRFQAPGITEATVAGLLEHAPACVSGLVALTTERFLYSVRSESWRRDVFPAHSAFVLECGYAPDCDVHDAMMPFSPVTVAFSRSPGVVRFFKVSTRDICVQTEPIRRDLQRLARQPAGRSQHGYVHSGKLLERMPTRFDSYSEETNQLRRNVGALGDKVRLGDVATILQGYQPLLRKSTAAPDQAELLIIGARNVTMDGRIDLSELTPRASPGRVTHFLQEGDVCIRRILPNEGGFVVGLFEGHSRPVTWNNTLLVVRPSEALTPAQRQVLFGFLRSPTAQRLIRVKAIGTQVEQSSHLYAAALADFPVPLADNELVTAIENLEAAKQGFRDWMREIDEAVAAILDQEDTAGTRRTLLQAGQLARQRFRAANQVIDLDYRVRNLFPHPLAYVWREVQVSGPNLYERFRLITKAAEAHTCFLAQLAILTSQISNTPIAYLETMAARLRQRRLGTSFGDWFAIIKEINQAKAFRSLPNTVPLVELRSLVADGIWEVPAQDLMQWRNDDSHGRVTPTTITSDVVRTAEQTLATLFHATEFLTDYRLEVVTTTRVDSLRHLTRFEYRDLSGDNPLAPLHSDESPDLQLEAGSLYLRDRRNMRWLLRPMLHHLECPQCHHMATFFLDCCDGTDASTVTLKSFERGSTRAEPLAEDFRHVGLLP